MTVYVCEYGWIICGREIDKTSKVVTLSDASVVRRWDNGKGIGGIVKEKNRNEYTLDAIGEVTIRLDKVLFEIPCEW